jgi:seryl-tRNA synthetase
MLDATLVREDFEALRTRLASRGDGLDEPLARLAELDQARRRILPRLETLKHERNQAGEAIARARREGGEATALLDDNKRRADEIKRLDAELAAIEHERDEVLLRIPNVPHESVPVGRTPDDNVVVRQRGEPPRFDFTPKPHWELGAALGILDFERAARLAGARFVVLKGAGARLSRALIDFMLDLHTREFGYIEVAPPYLANTATLTSTGHLPKFASDLFRVAGDWDLFLIPTAEVPLTGLHRDEILRARQLPLRYASYTACFRSEAGSYGKDVRGMYRQHQFDKVELVKIATPEQSYAELESMTANAEAVLERLGLAQRTVLLCTGDMGFAAAKTYDVEVWLPSREGYGEISSCSNTEAFQARRANVRFRREGTKKLEFAHMLNGSGLAVGRTIIAILENYQRADGSVVIPEALRPYMGGLEAIEPVGK